MAGDNHEGSRSSGIESMNLRRGSGLAFGSGSPRAVRPEEATTWVGFEVQTPLISSRAHVIIISVSITVSTCSRPTCRCWWR